jgi:DNA-binding Xre family transcriptional regulator
LSWEENCVILDITGNHRKRRYQCLPQKMRSTHGDVVPHLKQLLTLANESWKDKVPGIKVSQRLVAHATGINYKTVSEWFNHSTQQFDLLLLGRFCWYFDTDSVLSYLPASEAPPFSLPQGSIGRAMPPANPCPQGMLIRNTIPEKLAGARISEIAKGTGLSRNTVVALLNRERKISRIDRKTLAALCDYLSKRERRSVEVTELLVFDRDLL